MASLHDQRSAAAAAAGRPGPRRFGNIAHVWSTYEGRREPGGEILFRGINSIQLFRHPDEGWKIISMIWDNER